MDIDFLVQTFFTALSGVPIVLLIAIVSLLFAIPIGFILAVSMINKVKIISKLTKIYISFIRGTPLIVQIFIIYSSMPIIVDGFYKRMNWDIDIYEVNPIWYAFIVFSLNATAIIAEIFRSALSGINRGQLEAARAVGLTLTQSYRTVLIPQSLVAALPNLCTATTNLIKGTSLGYAMSLKEITLRAKVSANVNYNYIEAYIDIFLVYLILCSVIEFGFKLLESRARVYKETKGGEVC